MAQQHQFEYRWDTSVNHTQERLTQSYDYDANGYPTQVDLGNGAVETYQHDALGRLTQQVTEYGAQYDFAYDARDRRVHTELSNWERPYAFHSLYNGRQELGQWDEQLNPYRSLNTLPQEEQGLPYGTLISQEVHQWQNEEFRVSGFAKNYADKAYFHQDHLGSTVKISGENPTNAFRWDYTPMGEAYGFKHRYSHEQMTRTHVGHSPKRNLVPYLYQGKYETNLSGLVQMDARWYQPGLGRWLQPDYYNFAQLALPKGARQQLLATTSLNTQGLLRDPAQQMRYGYVSGNPLRWVDPLGLEQNWSQQDVLSTLESTPTGSVLVPLVSEDLNWEASNTKTNRTATYLPSTNTIVINEGYTSTQAAPVAAHELVHAIQDAERERADRNPDMEEILVEEVTAKNVGLNVWNELGQPSAPYDSTYKAADSIRKQSQQKHDEMWYKVYKNEYKNKKLNFNDLIRYDYEMGC